MSSIDRIKLLRSLSLAKDERPNLPPLGISVITSHLRRHGFFIVQDDLNAICFSQYSSSPCRYPRDHLRRVLRDRRRLLEHLTGGSDAGLTRIVEHVVSKTCCRGFDAICISVFPADDLCSLFSLLIAKYLKETLHPLIVMGGEYNQCALINEMFEVFYNAGIIDYYIDGYAEESLLQLFTLLRKGRKAGRLEGVRGLVYSDNGVVRRNEPESRRMTPVVFPEFEGLPLDNYRWRPDRRLLRMIGSYSSKLSDRADLHSDVLMLPFQFLTDCPNRCAFCAQSGSLPAKRSIKPPEEVAAEIKLLAERYGTRHFFFLNDTINISRGYIHRLCDEIIKKELDIHWSDCASARNMDEEILLKMKAAGAIRIVIGLESASPRLLQHIGKKVTAEMASAVLQRAHDIGITTGIEIIAGLPTENDGDVGATIEYLFRNRNNIDEVFLNHFYLERNSLMFKLPRQYGIENIREARKTMTRREAVFPLQLNFAYFFDEIDGLRWEEKKSQIHESFERIDNARFELGLVPANVDYGIGMLFYLSAIFDDPRTVREIYRKYKKGDILKRIINVTNIVSNLEDVRSVENRQEKISMLKWKLKKALHACAGYFFP